MPLYEYKCLNCEKVHEVIQKFADAPLVECPDCQGNLTKMVSLGSFSLKGSGWYTTDYKAKAPAAQTKPSPAAAPAPATPAAATPSAPSPSGSGSSTPSSSA